MCNILFQMLFNKMELHIQLKIIFLLQFYALLSSSSFEFLRLKTKIISVTRRWLYRIYKICLSHIWILHFSSKGNVMFYQVLIFQCLWNINPYSITWFKKFWKKTILWFAIFDEHFPFNRKKLEKCGLRRKT